MSAEQILRDELATHGDGAQALTAAQQATGLPRPQLERTLWVLLSGKGGTRPPSIAPQPPKVRRKPGTQPCPVCGLRTTQVPRHLRRQHPEEGL